MLSRGKWLNWIHPAREDSRTCKYIFFEIYVLSESDVWYIHGFTGTLPKKSAILSLENICHLLKKIRIVFKSMFSTITIDMDHWNTGNRINSRHLPSLSQPCLFDFHPFTNPRYFPSCLRENDSRDYFAGFFYCALLSFSVCSYH